VLLNRLYPRPGEVEAAEAIAHLDLGSRAPADRPYVVLNMVSTLDGKAVIEGTTRSLGGDADHALFHGLRTQTDAILAGAGTVRMERYGRVVRSDELTARRVDAGLDPNPPLVVVSGRLDLPPDLPLFQDPEARVIIATGAEHELEGVKAQVIYERTGDDLPLLMARLRDEHGIRSVLSEGGPTLNSFMLAAGLVDELYLSLSPQVVGGAHALTIVAGRELPNPASAELISLLESGGELFSRWKIRCTP
jgi:riboflavin-specific deaminase-like protein